MTSVRMDGVTAFADRSVAGPAGPRGPKGDPGEPGRGLEWQGVVSVYAELPVDAEAGEGWLVNTSGRLYVKEAGGWPAESEGIQLQGPQGETGDRGPQGVQGPIGERGPAGPQGDPGPQGERGLQGIQGATGPEGPIGPQGPQGVKGDKGNPGEVTKAQFDSTVADLRLEIDQAGDRAPTFHRHNIEDIEGLQEALDSKINTDGIWIGDESELPAEGLAGVLYIVIGLGVLIWAAGAFLSIAAMPPVPEPEEPVDDRPIVTINAHTHTWDKWDGVTTSEARDQLDAAFVEYGTTRETVEVLPFRLDTSQSTDLSGMFQGCTNLLEVDALDTSNVVEANSMFGKCSSLVKVGPMDTSKMLDTGYMFGDCTNLTHVPEGLDLSSTLDAQSMFWACESLVSVPDLNVSQALDVEGMFANCHHLRSVGNIDARSATNTMVMFWACYSLETVGYLDIRSSEDFDEGFNECFSLKTVAGMDTSSLMYAAYAFSECHSLESIGSPIDGRALEGINGMFYETLSLRDDAVSVIGPPASGSLAWSDPAESSRLSRFPWVDADGNPAVVDLDTGEMTLAPLVPRTYLPTPDSVTLETIYKEADERTLQVNEVLNLEVLKYDLPNLESLPFSIDVSAYTDLSNLFYGWGQLKHAPQVDTSHATNLYGMFYGCTNLETVPDLQTSNVTNAIGMFVYCKDLTDGNVRLLGKHPEVVDTSTDWQGVVSTMFEDSGLTRAPWFNTDGTPIPA